MISGKKEIHAELLDELEYTLITADVGVKTSSEILEISGSAWIEGWCPMPARLKKSYSGEHLVQVLESSEQAHPAGD